MRDYRLPTPAPLAVRGLVRFEEKKDCSQSRLIVIVLSLVFICRKNPRRSGILLFPDRPRFCRLMKTRNLRYYGGRELPLQIFKFLGISFVIF